jgi:hypothetical protein
MKISKHTQNDWCHLCGNRKPVLADVSYGTNSEHDKKDHSKYIRICTDCGDRISKIGTTSDSAVGVPENKPSPTSN